MRCLLVGFLWALSFATPGQSAEPAKAVAGETREFEILLDGKPRGGSAMAIVEFADGDVLVSTAAEVRLSFVVYTYVYQFDGKERWSDGQLAKFECQASDGGTKCATKGELTADGTQVSVDGGKPVEGPLFAMSTNYWRAPTAEQVGRKVPIIDTDTGKVFEVLFKRVGDEKLKLAGETLPCVHYQLSGDREAELWFDAENRLVRQTCVEDGYPTDVRLKSRKPMELSKR